jgi:hypothetical protein
MCRCPDVTNALKEVSCLVAKTSFPKWLRIRVLDEGRLFHLFSGNLVNNCIHTLVLGPMVSPHGNCHVS